MIFFIPKKTHYKSWLTINNKVINKNTCRKKLLFMHTHTHTHTHTHIHACMHTIWMLQIVHYYHSINYLFTASGRLRPSKTRSLAAEYLNFSLTAGARSCNFFLFSIERSERERQRERKEREREIES